MEHVNGNGNGNGKFRLPKSEPPPSPVLDHRRLVPGEVTESGDVYRDCMTGAPWVPAPKGVKITADGADRNTYLRPKSGTPVSLEVLYRALSRYGTLMCNESYRLQNMVTKDLNAPECLRCGGKGEMDADAMYCVYEYDEEDYEPEEGEEWKGKPKPPEPIIYRYDHAEDCEARWLMSVLGNFDDVFRGFLDTNGIDYMKAAKYGEDEEDIWL